VAGYAVAGLVLWGCARWEHSRAHGPTRGVMEEAVVPLQIRRSLRRSAAARRG
jgi:hypothetical protein